MDLFKTIKQRQSVRAYSNKEIKKEDLEKIVDSARLAPTARGEQAWNFIAINKKRILEEIANLAPNGAFIKEAKAAVVVISRDTKYYLEDASAATENILLAATALGIGSCWIAGDKKAYASKILSLLGVPLEYKLVSIVSLGYPAKESKPHPKKSLKEVICYNRFQS